MTTKTMLGRAGHLGLGIALAATGVGLVSAHEAVRAREAVLGAAISSVTTGTDTVAVASTQAFYWSEGSPAMFGLRVTPECTAAFILGPVLLLAAVFAASRRLRVRRVLAGTVAAVALILAMNAVRLGLVAWATYRFGRDPGYRWSHTVGGSVVSVIGLVVASVVFVSITFRGRVGPHFGERRVSVGP